MMAATAPNEFGPLLKHHRQRASLSQAALAQRVGVDQSYINRLESGGREPPRRALVAQLAEALELTPTDRQQLLLAAGHVPDWLLSLSPDDPTLLAVAQFLAEPTIEARAKADLRQIIHLLLANWVADSQRR